MEQVTKPVVEKSVAFDTYKIMKKVIKYTIYAAIIYFAFEGFMAWD